MITLIVALWLTASVPDKYIFPGYAPIPPPSADDHLTILPNEPEKYAPTKQIIKHA